ncbi:MAG: murein transglycosylase A [Acidobacteriota bacterium]
MTLRIWQGLCAVLLLWALAATFWPPPAEVEPPASTETELPAPPQRVLVAAELSALAGWAEDDHGAALVAFERTCRRWSRRDDGNSVSSDGLAGTLADWRPACDSVAGAENAPREFFERHFRPWQVLDGETEEGLLTGYYEPTLNGSRRPSERFAHPLYRRPPELVSVDLGQFRDDLEGRRLAGRIQAGKLRPFDDRAALDTGSLAGRGLELAWVDDPIDAFFLHIQGSGRLELDDGTAMRVGYAAQNGHPYHAIGRSLVDRGELLREEVSMQSIRRWLEQNGAAAAALMAENRSYIFFRELDQAGPIGSQGVVLTPERSLAVDRQFLPLGAPIWIDSTAPSPRIGEADLPLRRLLIAQDTGGAIRGPVRGDVFWGPGAAAAEVAGRMKSPALLWLLLPRGLDPNATGEGPPEAR